jgi:hypothetical protein
MVVQYPDPGWPPNQTREITPNPYLDTYREAGEEVSSTFEGRHVTVEESLLMHVDPGDGLVNKGQPVAFIDGVGIALKSATSTSEKIPIDTEGIWRVSVVVTEVGGIGVGQTLYITAGGVVTDDPTSAQTVFGYSMQQGVQGTIIVAVKVHWMSLAWLFWLLGGFFN